jgi:hypothetical protein
LSLPTYPVPRLDSRVRLQPSSEVIRRGKALLCETVGRHPHLEACRGKNFQRDIAIELFIVRSIHNAHSARTDFRDDAVMTERLADHEW